tara:strand:- start:76 stop:309 length:234 start_codon:yes stop_codon:yes gene_type:complete
MEWIHVDERLPEVGEPCWYHFDIVGTHRGFYGGLYEDEEGRMWRGMSIFYNDYGFLTGDVTHWHPDQEDRPLDPVLN